MNVFARVAEFLCLGSRVRRQIGFVRTCIQKSDETGGSLVEFAICVPILLMLVTGMMSFGIAINNYMTLNNAVEVGARQLAISRGQVTDPCSTISSTISSASPLLKSSSLGFTFNLNNNTASYTGTTCTAGAASWYRVHRHRFKSRIHAPFRSTARIFCQAALSRPKQRSWSNERPPSSIFPKGSARTNAVRCFR